MLDLIGDYEATAQAVVYYSSVITFGDFAFVNSLFALIYREVNQHMRVQELDSALRTVKSLSRTAFVFLRSPSSG